MNAFLNLSARACVAAVTVLSVAACAPANTDTQASEDTAPESAAPALETTSVGAFGKACGEDIAKHCNLVEPGDGRLQACLYAHQDLITDQCYAANEQAGVMLETVFDGYYEFLAACNADLNTRCADVEQGGGAQLQCLKDNQADISPQCRAKL